MIRKLLHSLLVGSLDEPLTKFEDELVSHRVRAHLGHRPERCLKRMAGSLSHTLASPTRSPPDGAHDNLGLHPDPVAEAESDRTPPSAA